MKPRVITYQGKTMSLSGWADQLGVPVQTLHKRLRSGWTDEATVSTPVASRDAQIIEVNGEALTVKEWSERLNITTSAIWYRLKMGQTPEEATRPKQPPGKPAAPVPPTPMGTITISKGRGKSFRTLHIEGSTLQFELKPKFTREDIVRLRDFAMISLELLDGQARS